MKEIDNFIAYISGVRRYSDRTVELYRDALEEYATFADDIPLTESLTPAMLRSYEVHLMDEKKLNPNTVGLHISILSSFCKYLIKQGLLQSNPVRSVRRPKTEKLLPVFYRDEAMNAYFEHSALYGSPDALGMLGGKDADKIYEAILRRLIIRILFCTGIRRAELISLTMNNVDTRRKLLRVVGKGDKMREIPLDDSLIAEISLYLQSCKLMGLPESEASTPLLRTKAGGSLFPTYVDRAVKRELGSEKDITTRKSPHVLRHTIATELLNEGAGLNSIKEMLGHSSLAATQVYTHNSIEKLKKAYNEAHPLCQSSKK